MSATDRDIRVAALRQPGPFIVEDVLRSLELNRLEWGTYVWHVVRDLVDEGLIAKRADGYYELAAVPVVGSAEHRPADHDHGDKA